MNNALTLAIAGVSKPLAICEQSQSSYRVPTTYTLPDGRIVG
jgi:hypothetical protein